MDQNNNQEVQNDIQYPFQAMLSEDQFHLFENVNVKLIGQNGKEIEFSPISGNLLITNERLCWYSLPQNNESQTNEQQQKDIQIEKTQENTSLVSNMNGKSFMFNYETLVSHGQQGDQFMCFLGSQEEEEMELEEEQEALIELIQQQNPAEIVNLGKGEYQIYFDLSKQSKETQNKINDIFTELATANVEMEDEGDEFMDEMITADNIDQDGNIIVKKQQQQEDQEIEDNDEDYEDVDDDDEEEEDNQFVNKKNNQEQN
ncbi:unnamed protein product [Paramecium pentaurelia]|uniref:Uncharacterized protein n=1 Tax=Paramecium pentaurelia TaxID=43138 RepID=A0A8S1TVF7_9CILI|nr:unnamed protein product [Paramecium pentaurelia]